MSYEEALRRIEKVKEENLTYLDLSNLNLKEIPKEVFELTNLTELSLPYNQVSIISKEIKNLNNLCKLFIHNNKLKELPNEIEKLINLREFYLSNNQLTTLPIGIGNLTRLSKLYLYKNQLVTLPNEIGNLINLEELDLKNNRLIIFPETMINLDKINKIYLSYNLLENIPKEILNKSPKYLIKYLVKNQISEMKKLSEAKVLFVGEGGVGKTSLINRILHNTFNQNESKTDGIKINKFEFDYENEEIKLNIWDFGGQEIMHSTHQFFLTNRSLYVLVWDARQEDRYGLIEYWLELIKSFGGESPLLIVMNKVDEHNGDIDKVFLREKYPNIKGFLNTSCKDNYNIDKLINEIKKHSLELSHIQDELPIDWFRIKDKLEELKKKNIDFISYDEYKKFCIDESIINRSERELLIGLLHDLGIILNFRDDLRLKDIGIINPLWVTDGVYKILNSEILMNQNGLLHLRDLEIILEEHRDKYPSNRDITLIDMMRKFELCFEIDRDSVLVPEALPKETPQLNWNKENSLAFMYQYNFLPQSIISRFIVKSHEMIEDFLMWRSGVILTNGKQKALIQADRKDKKIFIYIDDFGIKAREFLAIIRNSFAQIHNTIKTIEAKEKIPLPDNHKVVVDYEHLLYLESKGRRVIEPEGTRKEYNIPKLLDNIENKSKEDEKIEDRHIYKEYKVGDTYNFNIKNQNGNMFNRDNSQNTVNNNFNKELNTKLLELIEKIKESKVEDKNEIIKEIQNQQDENSLKTCLLNLLSRGAEIGSITGGIAGVLGLL